MYTVFKILLMSAVFLFPVTCKAQWSIYIAKNTSVPYATAEEAADAYFEHGKASLLPTDNGRCWRYYYELKPNNGAYRDMKIVNGRQVFGCAWPAPGGNGADYIDRIAPMTTCPSSDERCGWLATRSNPKNVGVPKCDGVVMCGNPFNLGTGNKVQVDTDFTVPGSPLLTFTRTYNSSPYAAVGNSTSRRWRHSFEYSLHFKAGDIVELQRPDGSVRRFNGLFPASPDETTKLAIRQDAQGNVQGWDYESDGIVESYDTLGRIVKLSPITGGYASVQYVGESLRPSQVVDNFGRKITFAYKGSSLVSVTTPENRVYSYGYNSVYRLATVTAPDGSVRKYDYDVSGKRTSSYLWEQLTSIYDESNTRIADFYYNKSGQVVRNEHIGGVQRVNVTQYSQGSTVAQNAMGATETYSFATIHGYEKAVSKRVSCPDGSCVSTVETMGYDANGNLNEYVDAAGVKFCVAYDVSRNLPTRRVEGLSSSDDCVAALANPESVPQSRVFDTQWHTTYRLPVATSGPLLRAEYTYDDHQRVLQITQVATADTTGVQGIFASAISTPRSVAYTYNEAGQVLTEDGPRTDVMDVMTYTYDAAGNLLTITDPMGHITRYSGYDAGGRPGSVTLPGGRIQSFSYDMRGRLTRVEEGDEATVFTYAPTGLLTQVTTPSGAQLTYGYDTAQRLVKVQDDRGSRIEYVRTALGNISSQKAFGPSATVAERQSSAVFDMLGRVRQLIGAH